ncbi:MAG TPA: hypothetical protein VIG64_03130 [Actinomycetota bacterium]|jgi:hypothetical protein
MTTDRARRFKRSLAAVAGVLLLVPGASPAQGRDDRPEFCDPEFTFAYDVDEATVRFELPAACVEQKGLGRVIVRTSLERCESECGVVIEKKIACAPRGACTRVFRYGHEPVERARYTARMSYRSRGGRSVVAGMSTRAATCNSIVEVALCD